MSILPDYPSLCSDLNPFSFCGYVTQGQGISGPGASADEIIQKDKSQGLRRSPKGLTFTFAFVGRAAAFNGVTGILNFFKSGSCYQAAVYGLTFKMSFPWLG